MSALARARPAASDHASELQHPTIPAVGPQEQRWPGAGWAIHTATSATRSALTVSGKPALCRRPRSRWCRAAPSSRRAVRSSVQNDGGRPSAQRTTRS